MPDDTWIIKKHKKRRPSLKDPVLIEGLPGIGNVGKISVDFLIDELKAKALYTFNSYSFPNAVFVNEDNLIELPEITLHHARSKGHDLLLLAGDIQPTDEVACYRFSEMILDLLKEFGGKEVITTGGIGLMDVPEKPQVFCTGNNKEIIERYKKISKVKNDIYGVVGPIVGITGLLLGMADDYEMEAISFLSETYGHPMYMGMKGSREILKILIKRFDLDIDLKKLEKEIKKIEKEMRKRKEDLDKVSHDKKPGTINYIG